MDNLIKPHFPDTYLLKSSDDFIECLKQFPFSNFYRIVSFDAVSLFTNVIICLLHHAEKICLSIELYVQELERLRHIFCNNGYSDLYINNTLESLKTVKTTLLINMNLIFFDFWDTIFWKSITSVCEKTNCCGKNEI